MRRSSFVLLFLAGFPLLEGCRGPDAPAMKVAAPAAPPQGWTVLKDDGVRLAIAIPGGWTNGVPKGMTPSLGDMAGSMGEGDPNSQLGQMAAEETVQAAQALEKLKQKGMFLHCVDGSRMTIGEAPTRFYVQRLDDCPNLRSAVAKERERMPAENEGVAFATPVGRAWFLESRHKNRIGDEERHVTYVFADGPRSWALRFESTNAPDVFDSFHRGVADSLRRF